MITYKEGDIFDYLSDNCVLIHQVNCQGAMGAGIAKTIRGKFPSTYQKYKSTCDKLSYAEKEELLGKVLLTREGNIQIANCFGQFRYGRDKRQTDYDALRLCFEKVLTRINRSQEILIPYKIGCNNAGGDWNIVSNIIEEVFRDYNVVIVKYKEN